MPSEGDKSFESLALPHAEMLYRIARRLSGNAHEAEELVQETYLKAFQAFARFEERHFGIRPWLLRILNNTFLNRRERQKRAPRSTSTAMLDSMEGAVHATSGSTEVNYDLLDDAVARALDQLGDDFRVVLVLWATRDMSYQEIADVLGIPIGTVMSRLHRARQQLTSRLATADKSSTR